MLSLNELDQQINQADTRQARINALNAWVWDAWMYNRVQAENYAREARALGYETLALGEAYWTGIAGSLLNTAHLHLRARRYDAIKSSIDDAWMIYLDLQDVEGQLRCMLVKSMLLLDQNAIDSAYAILKQALDYNKTHSISPPLYGSIIAVVARIYAFLRDYATAMQSLRTCVDLFTAAGETLLLGNTYTLLCEYGAAINDPSAITYGQSAIALHQSIVNHFGECDAHNMLARAWLKSNRIPEARQRVVAATMLANVLEDAALACQSRLVMGEVYVAARQFDEALNVLQQVVIDAHKLQTPLLEIGACEQLIEVYRQQKNYEWALVYSERSKGIRADVVDTDAERRVRSIVLPNLFETIRVDAQEKTQHASFLQQRINDLSIILQMYDEVSSNLKTDYVVALSLDAAVRLSGAVAGFIALGDEQQMTIRQLIGRYDLPPESNRTITLPPTLLQQLSRRKTLLMSGDAANIDGLMPLTAVSRRGHERIVIPLHNSERLIGILNLESQQISRFTYSVIQLLDTLKGYVVIALENATLYERLGSQYEQLQLAHQAVTTLEELKTDMLRLASHDLRTPLSVMKVYISLLRSGKNSANLTENQLAYLSLMDDSTKSMDRLITDILSLEKIEQMARSGSYGVIDLVDCVYSILETMRTLALQKQQTLVLEPPIPHARVRGDSSHLTEAMSNFITNAIKYTPDGGMIRVRLYADNDNIVYEVQDNGYGIPLADQDKIFTASYRVKNQETANIPGNGWGLYLVKKIVEYHRGTIGFASQHLQGSTFYFRIPIA